MIKWLQSKVVKVLYGTFLGLLLFGLLGAFPNTAFAACSGNNCNGKDPSAQGCATGAQTKKWIYVPGNVSPGLGQAQLRYSSTCNAK